MTTYAIKQIRPHNSLGTGTARLIGTIDRVSEEGEVFVDYPGNQYGPVRATILQVIGAVAARPDWARGDAVALLFEDGSDLNPLILGWVADRLGPCSPLPSKASQSEARLDGHRITLDAKSEIVLRCGNGSITLTWDGRIVIKGTEIVSRSSGANKIKGAVVNVN